MNYVSAALSLFRADVIDGIKIVFQFTHSSEKSPNLLPRKKRWPIGLLVLIFVFGSGYTLGNAGRANRVFANGNSEAGVLPSGLSKDVNMALFWDVWKEVKSHYVKQPVSDADLFHGAVQGMVDALNDPYSVYFKPELAEAFAKDLEGTFEGIGAEIGIKNDIVTVIAPLPGTPAEKAGLRAGDRIAAIDDKPTMGMSVEGAVNLIRGKGGTIVTLTVLRNGKKDPLKLGIMRDKIVVKSVRWEMKKTTGGLPVAYIQIRQFNDETAGLFAQAVQELTKQSPKGFVVDVRNNPGGYLDSAVQVTSAWVKGTIVVERKYDGSEAALEATNAQVLAGVPTVVLVNQGSASASEIFAGALQDGAAATLVGKKTFGKGSVQDYQQLPDGGALKLTVAEWLTPKKRSINKEGITPDVDVDLTDEDANADKDPQLTKALELIAAGTAKAAATAAH